MILIIIPPIPITRTTELISKFRLISKLTLFSTKIFKPEAAITPKRAIHAPPMTDAGIDCKSAVIFPMNETTIARTAAPAIT